MKIGPDGAIWVADWFNPIIGHYQASFRHPDRDKTHGRIWRVTAKGRDLVKKPKLVDATIPELLERLKDPEDWTRLHAFRRARHAEDHPGEPVLPDADFERELRLQRPLGESRRFID